MLQVFHDLNSLQTTEGILKEWLEEIGQKNSMMHVVKNILCTLSVVLAMHQTRHEVESAKLFDKICEGLHIQDLSKDYQNVLYERIQGVFDKRLGMFHLCKR